MFLNSQHCAMSHSILVPSARRCSRVWRITSQNEIGVSSPTKTHELTSQLILIHSHGHIFYQSYTTDKRQRHTAKVFFLTALSGISQEIATISTHIIFYNYSRETGSKGDPQNIKNVTVLCQASETDSSQIKLSHS